ncbi:hypothetical protein L915_02856 [Phytophthora nicotianae]|uniref:PiggyBac transposable element-derived protein domain-containing protein n=1 Tax=Phytophthora nicotianae TaxID=4792 RepID=W2HFJ7_PHYNI|nr:hypothetical protein L915_02856 [Phytophthora nicotianae]
MSCMASAYAGVDKDPRKPIRPFVDGFDERRTHVVSPGNILCVDERMSIRKGRENIYCHDGLPYNTKIARKPEGIGTELTSLARGESDVSFGLELVEGAPRQRAKPYARDNGEGGSPCILAS